MMSPTLQQIMQLEVEEQLIHNEEDSEEQQGIQAHVQSSSSQPSPKRNKPRSPNICSNKICSLYKHTKYNQTNQNNVQNLCPQCIKQYEKELYCLYCKQIYFQFTDDGKQWIMCDQCQRWVHTECADFPNNSHSNNFNCLRCRKIQVPPPNQINTNTAAVTSRRNNTRGSIGGKVPERRKTQECMLNNFGFYWQLSPAELAEDVEKLKQFMR